MKLKLPNSKKLSDSLKKWGLGATAVALAMTLSLSVGCDVAYCAAQKPKSDLDKLEMKYFQHMYPEKDNAARLRRLEKMVFGEEKTGTEQERLASILATVPDLGEEEAAPPPKATARGSDDDSQGAAPETAEEGGDVGDYPAVTAIEKHLFGKDFASEPVGGRLARLEKKQFGKISTSEDLSERVDALKMATSVDVTRKKPAGSEWAEEEEADDGNFPEPSRNTAHDYPGSGIAEPGEDGRSFSGRDLRKDFERAGMRRNASGGYSSGGSFGGSGSSGVAGGGSGSYGMSGSGSSGSGSGSYGMGAGSGSSGSYGAGGGFSGGGGRRVAQTPRSAPSYKSQDNYDPDNAPPAGGSAGASPGLTRQIDALEKEVFGKTFGKSKTLPDRVSDLEKTIFPQDTKTIAGISLEDRVARMTAVIPIAAPSNVAQQQQQYQQPPQQQYDPYNDPNMTANNGMPRRGGAGLGKIINSLGSFINGGMSVGGMGGYPMTGGYGSPYGSTYVDPTTGMVIRQNVPYMTNPYGGLGGFNNGFSSPYYSPYSNPMGGMGGMGGTGIRFGTGGFGSSSGFGGTWP